MCSSDLGTDAPYRIELYQSTDTGDNHTVLDEHSAHRTIEATSSIDSRTEKMVQEGMDRLMEGRTVFVIAHRLSTIVNSDVIMVMDHGHIIERGDHDSLMEQGGTYYRLYTGGLEID